MTVNDIARHAQVNRNTFYYHFENTETLAREAVVAMIPTEFIGALTSGIADAAATLVHAILAEHGQA